MSECLNFGLVDTPMFALLNSGFLNFGINDIFLMDTSLLWEAVLYMFSSFPGLS